MRIQRLRLRNWRNFQNVDLELRDRVFIVGPNASGKSNLLDAIRFLGDIARPGGGLQAAVDRRGGLSRIRCLAARRHPQVELDVELGTGIAGDITWRYELCIEQGVRGKHQRQPLVRSERVWRDGSPVLDRPDQEDKQDLARRSQTHLEQISANQEFRIVADTFADVLYLHLVPQLLRDPNSYVTRGIADDPYGRNFMERVTGVPTRTRDARLHRIEAALKIAVPKLSQLTLVRDDQGIPHLEARYEHWRAQGARQREDQFSDGTIRMIGLLWSLQESDGILLLEEPELSLNSAIVSQLPTLMARVARTRDVQVFVTTHSDDLLADKGVAPEETVVLQPEKEGTEARLASSYPDVLAMYEAGFSVGEAVFGKTDPEMIETLPGIL